MKTLREIKREAKKGDYVQVAEMVGKSAELVKKVINRYRNDHHNIQKSFSDLIEARERITEREERRRKREQLKEKQAA